jgi:hypothetical protein
MAGAGGAGGMPIMGHLGLGTTIKCDSTDNSFYCTFMKFMNMILMAFVLIAIVYYVYTIFIMPRLRGRSRK